MAVGKGGNQQNQNQSGAYSGTTSGQTDTTSTQNGTSTTSGTQTGQTSGTQTGQTAGQSVVDTTAGWDSVSKILQQMASGYGGMTPEQITAMENITSGAQNTGNSIDYAGNVLSQYVGNNHDPYQIADRDKIIAPTGAGYINEYTNPFESQVIDATRNDMTQGFKTGLNELRASYGGAMGNGREGVAAGTAADNFDRTLGTTLGNLRNANYGTAVQAGQGDAARQLDANKTNVDNGIKVDQFNVGQKNINDAQSIGVVNNYVNQQLAKNGILTDANKTRADISQGGFDNILKYLTSQNAAFGNSSTGTQSGAQSGTSSGTTDSTTATTIENIIKSLTSGTSSGTTSGTGNSSGKSGGISLG